MAPKSPQTTSPVFSDSGSGGPIEILATVAGEGSLRVDTIVVKTITELAPALAQRTSPIVIDNDEIERRLTKLERWQKWKWEWWTFGIAALVAAVLAWAIAKDYKIDAKWHMQWKVERFDGRLTLTPRDH